MRQIRKLLCLLLLLCVLLPSRPAALAEAPDADDERFAGKTWDQVVEEFLQSWGTDPENVGLGYYNTVTGEEHYLNADEYMITASMYKVPLNMVFLDRLSRGEMDWDTKVSGYPYEVVLEQTIVHSNNDIAQNMVRWELGNGRWQEGRRLMAPYCGLDPENVDWKFLENNYSTPRQMIYCLRLLYENPERFPRIVETMQRAEPTEYFKRRERRFNIAHKYGFLSTEYHLYLNDCGIAFTDDPILLVMFTDNVPRAYEVMTEYCTLMCDYAQYHYARRMEAEEAEAERLRQEAEQQAAQPPETAGPETEEPVTEPPRTEEPNQPGESPEPEPGTETPPAAPAESPPPGRQTLPTPQTLAERQEEPGIPTAALFAAGLTVLALLAALIALGILGRKYRVRRGFFALIALLLSLAALGRIFWPVYESFRDEPSGDPRETVVRFFDALAAGDYEQAYACLDGVETLGLEYEPRRESHRAIREAMRTQFAAELYGDCTVDGERAYQQVNCRYFDVGKLDREAKTEALLIISRYVSTHPVGDLYNENGNYRPELLMEAWDQAVETLLLNPENYRSSGGVQLELRWHDGAWRIVPNEKLLQLLTGGVKLTEKGGTA